MLTEAQASAIPSPTASRGPPDAPHCGHQDILRWWLRCSPMGPGCETSCSGTVMTPAVFYLVIRYGGGGQLMAAADFAIGTTMGVATVGTFLTVRPTVLFPRPTRHRLCNGSQQGRARAGNLRGQHPAE